MKGSIIFILSLLLIVGNMQAQEKVKRESRSERKAKVFLAVKNCIDKDSLVIHIDKIRPSYVSNVNVQSYYGYTGHVLKLINNRFSVNFIYIGEAPTAMMGEEKLSIHAKEQLQPFAKKYDKKKKITYYYLKFTNESVENTEEWECFIEIQNNGKAHIQMQTKHLNPMIYSGFLDTEDVYGNK